MLRRHWLRVLQFIVVLLSFFVARGEVGGLGDAPLDWIVPVFLGLLFLVCIYEIPVKEGVGKGVGWRGILLEISVVWIVPAIFGYLLGGVKD